MRICASIRTRDGGQGICHFVLTREGNRFRKLGAVDVVNYKTDANWGTTIATLAEEGVDLVIDIGGASTLKNSISTARVGGSVILLGMLGGLQAEFDLIDLLGKQQRILPFAVGSHAMQRRMVKVLDELARISNRPADFLVGSGSFT